jgi:segregation and condensation protein B
MKKNLAEKIESLLFASPHPLTVKRLASLLECNHDEIGVALSELREGYRARAAGVRLNQVGNEVEIVTAPEQAELVRGFVKDETTGELTRPQLETLSVAAYRAPVTKAEIEAIRGVNCGLILRNLMIRGLITSEETNGETRYRISLEFLRHLGFSSPQELPEYERFHGSEVIQALLGEAKEVSQ